MNKASLRCWLPLLLGFSGFSQASILNPDFSQGFEHWQAQVSQFDPAANESSAQSGSIAGLFPESFSLAGNSLTLSTAYQQDLENWSLVLFQDLQFDVLASGQSLWLSLSVLSWLSSADDFYFAQLRDLATDDVLDLTAGGSFDISSWTGRALTLEFGLQDNDFQLGDMLTVSDLNLRIANNAVPAPATALLLLPALWLLRRGGVGSAVGAVQEQQS
ncbi:hypothetical protein EOE67_19000 [Rheinheimera riviphila]|uniref:PEP-CTERM sorting domain-containing protein n=1 Tax=Rheinheimera riviphila TaxID=1834037 RepID=A0A437QC96_9GAMM|nr:hypothetical protein [Rheinheimera riviphila]RVU32065.1 hypothetical protein EOE67_19000 [Rheinheimera riviphila]